MRIITQQSLHCRPLRFRPLLPRPRRGNTISNRV